MSFRHTHAVTKIDVAWKPDCVYIECHCGHSTGIGLWYTTAPKGWAKTGWDKVIAAATMLSENWYKHLNKVRSISNGWVRSHDKSP